MPKSKVQDLEAFAEVESAGRGPVCAMCTLPEDLAKAIEEVRLKRADSPVPLQGTVVSKWLAKEGLEIKPQTVRWHWSKHV